MAFSREYPGERGEVKKCAIYPYRPAIRTLAAPAARMKENENDAPTHTYCGPHTNTADGGYVAPNTDFDAHLGTVRSLSLFHRDVAHCVPIPMAAP